MILVYVYLVQLIGGVGLLWRNNNLGIILLLAILIELMLTFWNPIYIFRRDWGSLLDLMIVYIPDVFRMAAMVVVAYILVRPEMYQTNDVDVISDNVHWLMPFVSIPSDSYMLRGDMLRVASCIRDDRGWDTEGSDGWVVAESIVEVRIPLERSEHLLLQKRGDGSIAVSIVDDPGQSYNGDVVHTRFLRCNREWYGIVLWEGRSFRAHPRPGFTGGSFRHGHAAG